MLDNIHDAGVESSIILCCEGKHKSATITRMQRVGLMYLASKINMNTGNWSSISYGLKIKLLSDIK